MMTVLRIIRILVIIQLLRTTRSQDGFSDRDILRYQQMSSDDGQIETITGFNIIQKDPTSQALSSSDQHYQQYVDSAGKNEDYSRMGRRKVYRIKNPFQNQDDNERPSEIMEPQDSSTGASNQYAAMQYSLPPEEFLQQLRAENQFYQQQQMSTPAPSLGFTVTPQPQYQYSIATPTSYDNSNQHQIQLQAKIIPSQSYYQYSTPSTFIDNIQSTPSPVSSYLSTPINTGQYDGTQSSTYVSSASPIYLSSSPNLQQYVSSPLSVIQTDSPDYNGNRVTTTIGSNSLSNYNQPSKTVQLGNYDYSANNHRYPMNIQQYQSDYTSTTTSSPHTMRESSWQSAVNSGVNALSKSLQELTLAQYQNYPYNNNQQATRTDTNVDNSNSDTHRIGSMASANNIYMNYAQPDNQIMNNLKIRTRDLENETGLKELYSNGDYGWKLNGKKPINNNEVYSFEYPIYQSPNLSSDSVAVSQMSFHMDAGGKSYNNEQVKPITESIESQEFAKAAAKAHERLKQQQQYYTNSYGSNNEGNSYYTIHDKQKNKYTDNLNLNTNQYMYSSNSQNDLITASPYLISNSRDSGDTKLKQPFDHDKALKNIVPIDVSNVVSNSGSALRQATNLDYNNQFSTPNYGKDQQDQNVRQYIRPVSDSYFKDKKSFYNLNSKTIPDDYVTPDSLKHIEAAIYAKQQEIQDQSYSQGSYPSLSQNYGYNPQTSNYQDGIQSPSMQQPGLQRNHNSYPQDIASLIKLNDGSYRMSPALSNDALKFHNIHFDQGANPIPTPLPTRINQNVDSHQLDVATNLINKLLRNKQPSMTINRPIESDSQTSLLPTINGFKVSNPFNVDLKLVAEMLKGKPTVDDSYMIPMRDTFNKPTPLKFDLSQLQHLLNNENSANLAPINGGHSALTSSYLDIYNNGRFPYQGVKYSRSQEEEESVPISDSTNNHPIGAVIEQDDPASEREVNAASDLTGQGDDAIPINFDEHTSKNLYISGHRNTGDRHRSLNPLSGRHTYPRKYPKNDVEEPYPLLKPPPRQSPVARSNHMKFEKNRRRRVTKPKIHRVMKSEPMFEAGVDPESLETSVSILLRPPLPVSESRSDDFLDEKST